MLAGGDRLYWIDIHSGRVMHQFPDQRGWPRGRAVPEPRGYGRAILAGELVYWPTYEKIFVFEQSSDRQARQPIDLLGLGITGGNLVVSNDTLLIAGAETLTALNPWGRVVEDQQRGGMEP